MRRIAEDYEQNDPLLFSDAAAEIIKDALDFGFPELHACCFPGERDLTQLLNHADRGRGFSFGLDAESIWKHRLDAWNHSTF